MARRVFFSFNYAKDIFRVNQIRNIPEIIGAAAAGFYDASLWEKTKKKGDAAIKKLIDDGLLRTSVTVVCVTWGTAQRKYINYEIDESIERGNGLVAIQIHHLKDQNQETTGAGSIPPQIEKAGFKAYKYTTPARLAIWVEEAAVLAGK